MCINITVCVYVETDTCWLCTKHKALVKGSCTFIVHDWLKKKFVYIRQVKELLRSRGTIHCGITTQPHKYRSGRFHHNACKYSCLMKCMHMYLDPKMWYVFKYSDAAVFSHSPHSIRWGGDRKVSHSTCSGEAGVEETAEVKREGPSELPYEERNKQLNGYIFSTSLKYTYTWYAYVL